MKTDQVFFLKLNRPGFSDTPGFTPSTPRCLPSSDPAVSDVTLWLLAFGNGLVAHRSEMGRERAADRGRNPGPGSTAQICARAVIEPPAARQPPASNDGASSPATSSLRRLVRFVLPGGGGGGWHAHIDRMENQLLPVESKYQRSILFFFSFFY